MHCIGKGVLYYELLKLHERVMGYGYSSKSRNWQIKTLDWETVRQISIVA